MHKSCACVHARTVPHSQITTLSNGNQTNQSILNHFFSFFSPFSLFCSFFSLRQSYPSLRRWGGSLEETRKCYLTGSGRSSISSIQEEVFQTASETTTTPLSPSSTRSPSIWQWGFVEPQWQSKSISPKIAKNAGSGRHTVSWGHLFHGREEREKEEYMMRYKDRVRGQSWWITSLSPFLDPTRPSRPMFYSALASASDLIHLLLSLHKKNV